MILISQPYFLQVAKIISDMGMPWDRLDYNLPMDLGAAPDAKIRMSFESFIALLSAAEAALNDPYIGLHIGENFRIPTMGEFTNIFAFAKDVEQAIYINCRYSGLIHSMGIPSFVKTPEDQTQAGELLWLPNFDRSDYIQYRQMTEYIITNYVMTLNWLTWGFEKSVIKVTFSHPAQAPIAEYARVLDCPVEFDARENAVILSKGILNRPLPTADYAKYTLMQTALERILASYNAKSTLTAVVEQKIRESLPVQKPDLSLIAAELNTNRRSLRRRLKEQGSSFETIFKDVKMDLCLSYMKEGRSFSEITYLLWYSDQSAFTRAFKTWFGVSPRHYEPRDNAAAE